MEIPKGKWEDLTFTYWMRHGWGTSSVDPAQYYQTVHLVYCPEPIQRNLPDALEGAGGWGVEGGVEVDGGGVDYPLRVRVALGRIPGTVFCPGSIREGPVHTGYTCQRNLQRPHGDGAKS